MSLEPRRRIFSRSEPLTVRLPAAVLLAAAAAVFLIVWWVQDIRGIMPCGLCLWERWPWRVVAVIGLVALIVPRRFARLVAATGILPLLTSVGLVVMHAGVEWQLWPSPLPECQAAHLHGTTLAQRLASMPLMPGKPCDAPTYLFDWLPLSMTVCGGIGALCVLAALLAALQGTGSFRR